MKSHMFKKDNYKGKRLLMLGNNTSSIEILQVAKKLGVYTIATDNIYDSPIKKIADKSYSVSTVDIDGLVKLVKSEKIDCIMTGASEFNIEKALTVSEKTGLPFYIDREQWEIVSNKKRFKDVCKSNNVPVIDEFKLGADFNKNDLENIIYPVIIKPVDSSGVRGISICNSENELRIGYKKALEYSKKKEILVEKYINGDEVCIYYTIQDGYISLSAMCDRYFIRQSESIMPLSNIRIFPSRYLDTFIKNNNKIFQEMFSNLNIKNGLLFVQAFYKNGKLIPIEMGYRLSGMEPQKIIYEINGIDPLEMFVRFSLSGEMSGWDLKKIDNPKFNKWACSLWPILKPGKIKNIIGLDELKKIHEIIDIVQFYYVDGIINESCIGTLKQALLKLFIVTDTKEMLIGTIKHIQNELKVIDENNETMLFEFNIDDYSI